MSQEKAEEYIKIAKKYVTNLRPEQEELIREIANCKCYGGEISDKFIIDHGRGDRLSTELFMKTNPEARKFCGCLLCLKLTINSL